MSILMIILAALLFAIVAIEALPVPENEINSYLTTKKDIVAFFNVYAAGEHYDAIVQEQVATIKGSGLLNKLDSVYYATMGEEGFKYEIGNSTKYVHLAHYGNNGTEMHTMHYLWQFCQANPTSKALYFHDKGSFHNTKLNERLRTYLNCFVLNTHCISALDDHDVCGWRASPLPYIHYSGNFWWARCSYVRNLIDPLSSINNQTFIQLARPLRCYRLTSRYAAESWIGSGPTVHPADCMNTTVDNTFIYGYAVPDVMQYCPGPDKPSGLPCHTASTLTHVNDLTSAYYRADGPHGLFCPRRREDNIVGTRLMYNDSPHTYLKWLDSLPQPPKLPEKTLVQFRRAIQVYIQLNGTLHAIPDQLTFNSLGPSVAESPVQIIHEHEKHNYKIGAMLPSVIKLSTIVPTTEPTAKPAPRPVLGVLGL